jgi:hypothetical protein
MRLPRMTTRGMMITTAVVGFSLGLMINVPWLIPLLLLMAVFTAPQTIIVGVCAYAATRPIPNRSIPHEPGEAGVYFIGDEDT